MKTPWQTAENDPHDLNRFVRAQEGDYEEALAEIKRGRKESHWIWFIFPQMDGLGRSEMSRFYGIKSRAEAKAYLQHPLLGRRLIECCNTLLRHKGKSVSEILGFPDDMKLRSSMTLFQSVSEPDSVFAQVLGQFFDGELDKRTLELLDHQSPG